MAVYFVTGKLGSGKTLCTIGKAKEYLEQGRRVASNLDLHLENMLPYESKQSAVRLPDKPRLEDMEMLGDGCVESDESKYGLIILDELGTWFNSRNWRDKERLTLIDWFLHARKHHWDIFFIVQSLDSLDGQLISSLCEHLVVCKRTDRLSIPIIGSLIKSLGFSSVFPKVHIAKVYYGSTETAMAVDRWWYKGHDLYNCYDTDQKFTDAIKYISVPSLDKKGVAILDNDHNPVMVDEAFDLRTTYTVLPPYYTNAIALQEQINLKLHNIINKSNDLTATHPTGVGRLKQSAFSQYKMAIPVLCLVVLSVYKMAGGAVSPVSASIASKPINIIETAVVSPTILSQPLKVVTVNQSKIMDKFQDLLSTGFVRVESFVQYGDTVRAKIKIVSGENSHYVSLTDLRMNGYWIQLVDRDLRISKQDFNISIQI